MWLCAFLLLIALRAAAATVYEGKVIHIADGDTLTILWQGKPVKVRLAEIDTPEKRQPFGTQAKKALAALAFGKLARVVAVTVDRYGRTVGRVYVGGVDVNATLVRGGGMRGSTGGMPTIHACTRLRKPPGPQDEDSGPMRSRSHPGSGGTGRRPSNGAQRRWPAPLSPVGLNDTAGK